MLPVTPTIAAEGEDVHVRTGRKDRLQRDHKPVAGGTRASDRVSFDRPIGHPLRPARAPRPYQAGSAIAARGPPPAESDSGICPCNRTPESSTSTSRAWSTLISCPSVRAAAAANGPTIRWRRPAGCSARPVAAASRRRPLPGPPDRGGQPKQQAAGRHRTQRHGQPAGRTQSADRHAEVDVDDVRPRLFRDRSPVVAAPSARVAGRPLISIFSKATLASGARPASIPRRTGASAAGRRCGPRRSPIRPEYSAWLTIARTPGGPALPACPDGPVSRAQELIVRQVDLRVPAAFRCWGHRG